MSKLSNQNRKCNICRKVKSISEFSTRQDGLGKLKSCTKCYVEQRQQKIGSDYKRPKHNLNIDIDLTKPLDLNFLLDLNGWIDEEIKQLLVIVKTYSAAPYRMKPRDIFKRYYPSRTTIACAKILNEFKEAAQHGMSFDDYLKDRKFRKDGKRGIAGGKKK